VGNRMSMALVAFALTLSGSVTPAIRATAQQSTHCSFVKEVVLSPGFSMAPTSGVFTTNGEQGTIECDGPVDGKPPVGVGSIGTEGRYGTEGPDTCTSGTEGEGVDSVTIPTADGPVKLLGEYTFTGGDPPKKGHGLISGRFEGKRFSGTFEATPLKGDCVTSPITVLRVVGEGILR
jgi:hypothetical protein